MERRSNKDSCRSFNARIGGLSLHITGDSEKIAARARQGLEAKFIAQALEIDPNVTARALAHKVSLLTRLRYMGNRELSSRV